MYDQEGRICRDMDALDQGYDIRVTLGAMDASRENHGKGFDFQKMLILRGG
jgi:hypothetical protein